MGPYVEYECRFGVCGENWDNLIARDAVNVIIISFDNT